MLNEIRTLKPEETHRFETMHTNVRLVTWHKFPLNFKLDGQIYFSRRKGKKDLKDDFPLRSTTFKIVGPKFGAYDVMNIIPNLQFVSRN